MKKNWSLKLNNKKIKPILFIIFSIILTLFFGIIRLWIILARPDITYRGSKIVPQGDIIYLNKINISPACVALERMPLIFYKTGRYGTIFA